MNCFEPYLTFPFFTSHTLIPFILGRNGSLKPSQTKKEKNKKKKYHHNTCHSLSEWCVCFNEPFLPILRIPIPQLIDAHTFPIERNGSLTHSQKKQKRKIKKRKQILLLCKQPL